MSVRTTITLPATAGSAEDQYEAERCKRRRPARRRLRTGRRTPRSLGQD